MKRLFMLTRILILIKDVIDHQLRQGVASRIQPLQHETSLTLIHAGNGRLSLNSKEFNHRHQFLLDIIQRTAQCGNTLGHQVLKR